MVFGMVGRLFKRIKTGLSKTRSALGDALRSMIGRGRTIDQQFLEELEDTLLAADISYEKVEGIIDDLKQRYKMGEVAAGEDLMAFIKTRMRDSLQEADAVELTLADPAPTIILVVGVNGVGKTTSIAKLAKRFSDQGHQVLLAAGDTYRAAAIDQLSVWAERVGVDLIKQHPGADPAAVAFDAVVAAEARGSDIVIVDTAGRLHNREDLMRELEKMRRVLQKHRSEAPHETFLVVDATAGQNAIQQAKIFSQSMGVTGLILTKLDGTAKGGCVISIKQELGIPVRYIGIGEHMDDLQPFDPDAFLSAILGDESAEVQR